MQKCKHQGYKKVRYGLLFLLAASFMLLSCSKKPNAEGARLSVSVSLIACSDKGAYYEEDQKLFFTDFLSGQSVPLCNKPNCAHNTSSCNAVYGGLVPLGEYDKKVYVWSEHTLYASDLDGENRKKIADYDFDAALSYGSVLEDGWLFFFGSKTDASEDYTEFHSTYFPVALNVESKETRIGQSIDNTSSLFLLGADTQKQEMVYATLETKYDVLAYLSEGQEKELEELGKHPENFQYDVFCFDFANGTTTKNPFLDSRLVAFFYDGSSFLCKPLSDQGKLLKIDADTGQEEELLSKENGIGIVAYPKSCAIISVPDQNGGFGCYFYSYAERKLEKINAALIPSMVFADHVVVDKKTVTSLSDW
jgi:hypothetical protein